MIEVTPTGARTSIQRKPPLPRRRNESKPHRLVTAILTLFIAPLSAQVAAPAQMPLPNPPPARITTADLAELDTLPEARRKLIAGALAVLNDSPWLPYLNGGASPDEGGFDCSGAMYFVMRKAGLDPPRSSGGQFKWLKENNSLHEVTADAVDEKDPSLADLKPGDLLFWKKTEPVTVGPIQLRIHHVAMFLGTEKKDGRPVMINATDGRSYRGTKANGYGVYDFRVPKADSLSKLAGYGTPPGLDDPK